MAYEERDMGGSLFKNEKTKDNQPDYTGKCLINGETLRIAAWIKEGRSGKFMSLKFQPNEQQQEDGYQKASREAAAPAAKDDEFPF